MIHIIGLVGFLSILYGLKLTLWFLLIPIGGEAGTYTAVLHPWVDADFASPVHQILSGMYTKWIGRSQFLLLIAYGAVDWCPLILVDVDLASDSKYVPKLFLDRVIARLFFYCTAMDLC